VITATQMLDSMIRNPRPTRAEVTDVYNAIHDGADAVMLSGETAIGDYPLGAVRMMERLASEAEKLYRRRDRAEMLLKAKEGPSTTQSICHAVSQIAEDLNLDCIIVPTKSGHSARHISQFRPRTPILAYSMHDSVVNQLCLSWGVHSRLMEEVRIDKAHDNSAEALVDALLQRAKSHGFVKPGDKVVALGGLPLNQPQITNFLRVVDVE
jgi:pyruvate kinase